MSQPSLDRDRCRMKPGLSAAGSVCRREKMDQRSSFSGRAPRETVAAAEEPPLVELEGPPPGLEEAHRALFTPGAVAFVPELLVAFEHQVDELHARRLARRCLVKQATWLPTFRETPPGDWRVAPLPARLRDRRLDLGDVSPSNRDHVVAALSASVQGVQVDFDDGHCPTWRNQIAGLYNVCLCVRGQMPGLSSVDQLPVLMMRPRAWNMVEDHMVVGGRRLPAPLFDFALLVFHVAEMLSRSGSGPFFYLSKVEGAAEARLWDSIFTWTERRMGLPHGTIKACVLIENILSSFELEGILYELKNHSLGLNCGIWDYAASIVSKFGDRREFVLPDRSKYVSMERRFLRKYLQLVVSTSHRRGAMATGGMAAQLLPQPTHGPDYSRRRAEVVSQVKAAKMREIAEGVDGFLVYDVGLVPYMNELWDAPVTPPKHPEVTPGDLLGTPSGGVTAAGLRHNVAVAVLFVSHWLCGRGHFVYRGAVEDSATAEISRCQVWQWVRHAVKMEDVDATVTVSLVRELTAQFVKEQLDATPGARDAERRRLSLAADVFLELVTRRDCPEFITTYLYESHAFRASHGLPCAHS